MSFIKDKILKVPDVRNYTPREVEVSRQGFDFGFRISFVVTLVFYTLFFFFLAYTMSTTPVHATELVGSDTPIETPYNNYAVFYRASDDSSLTWVTICINFEIQGNYVKAEHINTYGSAYTSSVIDLLCSTEQSGRWSSGSLSLTNLENEKQFYCYTDTDFSFGTHSFQRAPFLIHKGITVGGLQAPEIAEALTAQVLGLVPLAIGLVVLALGLWKGLGHIWSTLARA